MPVTGGVGARAGFAQERKLDAIESFSASLESLSQRVNRSVVKIVTTGFGISEDSDSGNASLLTRQRATGSGVILTPDGYIVTNAHVIQGARRIRVQLPVSARAARLSHSITKPAGTILDARIVGQDRETDIAVLKIDATDLPFLTLGDSRELRQGQLVMAFGSPLGLQNSASLGVVSAAARQLKEDSPMIYIQTDASINPGNSGGPLVDMSGRVVGLNTMILSQSGGSEGIGFAIPSDTLRNVYTQIRKEGHVHRGQIGASVETITPLLAAGLGLPQDWGVLVADATPDGPADKCRPEAGRHRAQPGWQAHGERAPTGGESVALSGGRQSQPGGAARRLTSSRWMCPLPRRTTIRSASRTWWIRRRT